MINNMDYEIKLIQSMFIDCNCYLINYLDKTVIIDPCVDVKTLCKYNVKKVEGILITHGHVDHILFLEQIVKHYNCKVYLTKHALEKVYNDNLNLSVMFNYPLNIQPDTFKYEIITDNKIIINDLQIKCITTPGHTNGSVCFLLKDDLFTGDTLFNRSVGRTDFPTGNSLELRNSLKKILSFNKNFTIYPGHDSISTIEEQKQKNYYLKF